MQGKIAVYGNIIETTRMPKFTTFEKSTRKTSGVGLNYPRENMYFVLLTLCAHVCEHVYPSVYICLCMSVCVYLCVSPEVSVYVMCVCVCMRAHACACI